MPSAPRQALLAAAQKLLIPSEGGPTTAFRVTIETLNGKTTQIYLAGPEDFAPAAGSPAATPVRLTPLERDILTVASGTPTPAKQLAALLERTCSSSFRGALRSLCRREPPLLVHTPDGYRIP